MILETPRLILRELVQADIDALAEIYADPETMRFFDGPRSRDAAVREIEHSRSGYLRGEFGFWATVHKKDRAFLGRCGLLSQVLDETRELEVAYMIARPYWGRGLGTEVAQALRDHAFINTVVPRVVSIIAPENLASIRVAEKAGMRYVKDVMFQGYLDRLYAVQRPDGEEAQ